MRVHRTVFSLLFPSFLLFNFLPFFSSLLILPVTSLLFPFSPFISFSSAFIFVLTDYLCLSHLTVNVSARPDLFVILQCAALLCV